MTRLATATTVGVVLLVVASLGATVGAGAVMGGLSVAPPSDSAPTVSDLSRLECTNATSNTVVECGFNPTPTAVELDGQQVTGNTVTVEAVDLKEGGFVAVHRVSFVDGAFTTSVMGVSEYLGPGLHENIEVTLDDPLTSKPSAVVAVVYRDSDDDRRYDFVATDGADDRPYTMTYTNESGNVTDEAGKVIGDSAVLSRPSSVGAYAGANEAVETSELQTAIMDWMRGDIDAALLRELIAAWVRSTA